MEHLLNLNIQNLNSDLSNKSHEIESLRNKLLAKENNLQILNDHIKLYEEASSKLTKQIFAQTQTI